MSEAAVGAPRENVSDRAAVSAPAPRRHVGKPLRIAFLGPAVWLDCCAPPAVGLACERFALGAGADVERMAAGMRAFDPDATVIFDPSSLSAEAVRTVRGATLGVLVGGVPEGEGALAAGALDRLVSFDPALTGAQVGEGEVWRAIPPPVNDLLYGDVRPLRHAPRVMSIGRSTAHREAMLMPAKHNHDLLQAIHGVSGALLVELMSEYDAGVYIPREAGGGFGWQVGVHLAAGQLLLTETLRPEHGLECNIDYLKVDSPEGLVWVLDRMGRFPEMYQRIRVRGHLKAAQYRASRLFARIAHDLLADVAAFGPKSG